VLTALEDAVFGDAAGVGPLEVHGPSKRLCAWLSNRVLVEAALKDAAAHPDSAHRGLSLAGVDAALGHPLAHGTLRLELNLRQRLAAVASRADERDHIFLKLRAQYVRLRLPLHLFSVDTKSGCLLRVVSCRPRL
jgi:hypothetical protein